MTALSGTTPGPGARVPADLCWLAVDSCLYFALLHCLSRQCFPTVCWAGLCSVRKCCLGCSTRTQPRNRATWHHHTTATIHQLIGAQLSKKPGLREAGTEERGSKCRSPPHNPKDATHTGAGTLNEEAKMWLEAAAEKLPPLVSLPGIPICL